MPNPRQEACIKDLMGMSDLQVADRMLDTMAEMVMTIGVVEEATSPVSMDAQVKILQKLFTRMIADVREAERRRATLAAAGAKVAAGIPEDST